MAKNPIQTAEYQRKNHSPSRFFGLADRKGRKKSGAESEKTELWTGGAGLAWAGDSVANCFEGERMRFLAPGEAGPSELMMYRSR